MVHRLILILMLVGGGIIGLSQRDGRAATTLYPDLQTMAPADLVFAKRSDGTHILRFSNTVKNMGPGRLEIQGNPKPRKRDQNTLRQIYQNLYDAPLDGNRTAHLPVASDAVYHAGHQHFHFADFALYELLVHDGTDYVPANKHGTKTSFCIMDTTRVPTNPPTSYPSQYQRCGGELQGLTPGWGDTYDFTLIDQWVVLGKDRLADGEYGLRSIADPYDKLDEAAGNQGDPRESNNTAVTYFTASGNGTTITNVRDSP